MQNSDKQPKAILRSKRSTASKKQPSKKQSNRKKANQIALDQVLHKYQKTNKLAKKSRLIAKLTQDTQLTAEAIEPVLAKLGYDRMCANQDSLKIICKFMNTSLKTFFKRFAGKSLDLRASLERLKTEHPQVTKYLNRILKNSSIWTEHFWCSSELESSFESCYFDSRNGSLLQSESFARFLTRRIRH